MQAIKTLFFQSPWLYTAVRFLIGLLFVVAGGLKLLDPRAFARIISAYNLAPEEFLVPLALGIPAIELLAGLGLIFNVRGSLKAIFALLVMFLCVLTYAVINNLDVDCGCFSAEEIRAQKNLKLAVLRDIGLIGVCCYLLSWQRLNKRYRTKIEYQPPT